MEVGRYNLLANNTYLHITRMTIEQLLDCPADRWESLSDSDLMTIAIENNWLVITRPDLAAKKRETTSELMAIALDGDGDGDGETSPIVRQARASKSGPISADKKAKIMAMAAAAGVDVKDLF